mgnify:CR=1 FL=1
MACGEEARAAFNAERRGDFLLKSDIPMPDADLRTLCSKPDDEFGIRMEAIGKDCECHLGGGPLTVQRLNRQGTLHRLFLLIDREGSRRILRVPLFDSGYFECLMRLEAVTSTYVRARKIRAPEIQLIELRVGGGSRTCHLVEVMEGIPVASVDDDELMCVRLLAEICDVLRRIHAIEAQGFGPLSLYPRCNEIECDERAIFRGVHASWADFITVRLDDHLSTCERIGAISGAEAALTGKVFSGSGSLLRNVTKAAVLHGDPGSHNFITRESAITGVLDWEDCLVGDPAYDVANQIGRASCRERV